MGYGALLVVALLTAPFWHPSNGGLFLFVLFLMLGFALWFSRRLASGGARNSAAVDWQPSSVVNPAVLVLVVWLVWYMTLWAFSQTILAFRDALVFGTQVSDVQLYLGWFTRAQIPLLDNVILFLKKQGAQLPCFLAAGVISLTVWRRLLFRRERIEPSLAAFSFLFPASIAVILALGLAPMEFESSRLLPYAILFATVVSGLGLWRWVQRYRRQGIIISALIIMLVISGALGIFNIYNSPFTLGANDQVTQADMEGMRWFVDNRDDDLLIEDFAMNQWTLASALHGRQKVGRNFRLWQDAETVEHFGYDEHDTYGASFEDDRYFLSHTMSRVIYTERMQEYEESWRWTPEDFERLENDPTVARIYNSGGFEVFLVEAEAEQTD